MATKVSPAPASPEVAQLQALLHDQPANPMRPNVVEYHSEELKRLEDIVKAPAYITADRGFATKKHKQIRAMLDSQMAKPIEEPIRREAVDRLAADVLERVIKPAMLTHEEMRRNPVGAVDGFLKRENARPIKDAILTWKRAMRALDPENTDQDYTNMERFRRNTRTEGAATFMANAQIPGNFAMTPVAKENWPLGDPTASTALGQVTHAEVERAVARKVAAKKAVQARWRKRDAKLAAKALALEKKAARDALVPMAAEG